MKEVWETPRPKKLGKPQKLSPNQKKAAKSFAKRTNTPSPSLVANIHVAKAKKGKW